MRAVGGAIGGSAGDPGNLWPVGARVYGLVNSRKTTSALARGQGGPTGCISPRALFLGHRQNQPAGAAGYGRIRARDK